jgi:hypothetical protein
MSTIVDRFAATPIPPATPVAVEHHPRRKEREGVTPLPVPALAPDEMEKSMRQGGRPPR